MFPSVTYHNKTHSNEAYAELLCNRGVSHIARAVKFPNLANVRFGELSAAVIYAGVRFSFWVGQGNRFAVLRDVLPIQAANDTAYVFAGDTELLGKDGLRCPGGVKIAYLSCLLSSQYRAMHLSTVRRSFWVTAQAVIVSLRSIQASFALAISGVLNRSAQKQMMRIAARRIVASVAHHLFEGINSVVEKVRHTMGFEVALSNLCLPITSTELRFLPGPALIRLTGLDTSPKVNGVNGVDNRKGFHSMFTSYCLPDVMSASGGKNRCSVINLADYSIIPQKGTAL